MMGRNPTVAALLGFIFGPLAYLYVWRIGRGLVVFALNFIVFSLLFGDVEGYPPEVLAASLTISILISFDCWRIAKLSKKEVSVEGVKETIPQTPALPKDIYCPQCGVGLAIPVKTCPMCGAETRLPV